MTEKDYTNMAKGVVWNLDELYQGDDDPSLDRDLRAVREKAERLASFYRDKLNKKNLSAQMLLSAIEEYESVHEMGMKPYAFAYLYQASDLRDQRRTGLFQKVSEAWNEISEMLTFFLLEIMALPEAFLESLANHDALLNYRHFLLRQFQWKPYTLSEPEEKIIKRKNLSGRKVFVSLYDELMGSLSFPVEIEGQRRSLSTDQVLSLLHSPDRSLRENAYQTLLEELGRQGMFFKNILNALVLDHYLENLERGHPSPMHRVCLSDGVDDTAIETMMEAVERHYPLAQRYFHLKARFLGLEKLKNTDLLAPLTKEGIQIPFSRAKRLVLEAIENLHPLIYSIGCEFFERKWIDAEMRKGKRVGAFCKCFAPFLHPFLSINYSGSLRDVMTLAHELGHGIHYRLAAKQSYLNFDLSPTFAETAATLNEIILTQHLVKRKGFKAQFPTLLSSHIEAILTTVYRQNVFTRFEQAIHRLRQDHLLSEEEICQLWWEENYRLYGDDVEMIPAYRWGWTHIPHFVHRPFYCYSYIFGSLLSMILYQNYKDKGGDFLERIIHLFGSGSSQAPLEILAQLGLDLRQKSFWEQAFKYIIELIDSFEML